MSVEIPVNSPSVSVTIEPQVVVAEVASRGRELTPVGFFTFDGEPVLTFRGSQIAPLT